MARRHRAEKRPTTPDPLYGSALVAKFINHVMVCGKKSIAQKIVYGALEVLKTKTNYNKNNPLVIFERAIENVRPMVEVKSRRVGGATYPVPVEINKDRAIALAMRWVRDFARQRGEKGMMLRLAGEIMDAADEEGGGRGKGGAVKKREDTHRMAEANKAFSHFRW